MKVGVPKETGSGEARVSLTPAFVPTLTRAGLEVEVQAGAGAPAGYDDAAYVEKGAQVVPTRQALFAGATSSSRSGPPPRTRAPAATT